MKPVTCHLCQTSLDWESSCGGGLYSISSIYQLNDCQVQALYLDS